MESYFMDVMILLAVTICCLKLLKTRIHMKLCIFNTNIMKINFLLLIFMFCLHSLLSVGQEVKVKEKSIKQIPWHKLIPDQAKLQFAGSMGMFSLGPGWYYGNRSQWETDVFIGFIPSTFDMDDHFTMTFKETWTPFVININRSAFLCEPITTGLYINKIFGDHFWDKLPHRYPKNYYFWATNTRFNIFLGQAITFINKVESNKSWSFFYEVNKNDLYLLSAWKNDMIKITDIINISFGLRYRVFDYRH
jgi:hypothetical protein